MLITTKTSHWYFFFGRLKINTVISDPDARIGYCIAKKKAFIGYRGSMVITGKNMVILDFLTTAANVPDCHSGHSLFMTMNEYGTLGLINVMYGDNAYDTADNRNFLWENNIQPNFHDKSETGKNPINKRSARRKSRIRSKIEAMLGILTENYSFHRLLVRRFPAVITHLALIYTAWNFFFLMSWFVEKFEYRISIKSLLKD